MEGGRRKAVGLCVAGRRDGHWVEGEVRLVRRRQVLREKLDDAVYYAVALTLWSREVEIISDELCAISGRFCKNAAIWGGLMNSN